MREILQYEILTIGKASITVGHILISVLVLLCTWLALRLIKGTMRRRWGKVDQESARAMAVYKLLSYFIWTSSLLFALDVVGVRLTFLLAGGAALLVGVGLGIQQTFNDMISGVIILAEGTIRVGDVMEVDGLVGRVTDINLRTTKVLSRDDIHILVPNHKFINENVVNWSHTDLVTRFHVGVGVSYGTDPRLVERVLISCARENTVQGNGMVENMEGANHAGSPCSMTLRRKASNIRSVVVRNRLRRLLQVCRIGHQEGAIAP